MTNKLQLFEGTTIRTIWDSQTEEWYFSVADVCNVLSGSQAKDPNAYWRKLKQRLKAEGSEIVTNCHGLKLESTDGKKYMTDVLSTRDILRLVQSIPSPKSKKMLKLNRNPGLTSPTALKSGDIKRRKIIQNSIKMALLFASVISIGITK